MYVTSTYTLILGLVSMRLSTILVTLLAVCIAYAQAEHNDSQPQASPDDQQYHARMVGASSSVEIEREIEEARKVLVNMNHSQHYAFLLSPNVQEPFIFAVDVDQAIQAMLIVYWEEEKTYIVSQKQDGEEVRVYIFEDGKTLIGSWVFYHATGIRFQAKKEHEYLFKVFTNSKNKMIIMDVEHFISKGSSGHAVNQTQITPNEQALLVLKNQLETYFKMVDTNQYINSKIAENVNLHMQRFMLYQIVECLLIIALAVLQSYLIRKLLSKGYSLV